MQLYLTDVDPQGGRYCSKVGDYREWTNIIVQVFGPQTLFFSDRKQYLIQDTSNGRQGFQVAAAQGIVSFWWFGELWLSASAPLQIEFSALSAPVAVLPAR